MPFIDVPSWWITSIFFCAGLALLALTFVRLILPLRVRKAQCGKCGYAMQGLPAGQETCPECGKKLEPLDREYRATWRSGPLPISPQHLFAIAFCLSILPLAKWGPDQITEGMNLTYLTAFNARANPDGGSTITCTAIHSQWETRTIRMGPGSYWKSVRERTVKGLPTLIRVESHSSYGFNAMMGSRQYPKVLYMPAATVNPWPLELKSQAVHVQAKMVTRKEPYFLTPASQDEIDQTIADLTLLSQGYPLPMEDNSRFQRFASMGQFSVTTGIPWWLTVGFYLYVFCTTMIVVIAQHFVMRRHLARFNAEIRKTKPAA